MYWTLLHHDHDQWPVPSRLDLVQCGRHVVVDDDGLSLDYRGGTGCCAAMAISLPHVPPQCAIFYFEVLIVDAGRNGFVTVGMVEEGNDLEKLIGWEERSIGYHGDDGKVYNGAGATSVRSLNQYGTDDTVGCLVNFHTNQVAFTKNGQTQGAVISFDLTTMKTLHAAISSKSPASSFKVNFGAESFLFDIYAYIREQKRLFYGEINKVPDLFPYQELALVYGYLRFHGHVETAEILWKTSQMEQLKPSNAAEVVRKTSQSEQLKLSKTTEVLWKTAQMEQLKSPNVRASTGKMQKLSLNNVNSDRLSHLEISLMQLLCCIAHASEYGVSEPAMIDSLLTYTYMD